MSDCTVAVDAMGGDRAPGEIVAGAQRAADELGVRVLLVGREDEVVPLLNGAANERIDVLDAREVVAMDDEPLAAVRKKKDSSLVRCAEAVRDGKADAMVSAGNTGAATAAAVLRLGRIKGVPTPAIAVPIPVPGEHPQLLVDAGAVVDPAPERLVQYALMAAQYARSRFGIEEPRVGLLSNGEEAGKGDELRKKVYPLLEAVPGFVGNVEGRDFMHPGIVDVVVTDGFTGNIALKCLEGALRSLSTLVFNILDSTPEAKEASATVLPMLLEAAEAFDPDVTGGALLLGLEGVCVISHGSSSARGILSAVEVAAECVDGKVIERTKEALANAG
jgi:glycerol-3-phosphate acyltransferase PlsX